VVIIVVVVVQFSIYFHEVHNLSTIAPPILGGHYAHIGPICLVGFFIRGRRGVLEG